MKIEDLHDEYGCIVYIDVENELCVGVMLEDRAAKIYFLNYNKGSDLFPGYEIVSEEDIEYYDLIDDFPDAFNNCENAEAFFRGDIFDDDVVEEVLSMGQEELENKSIITLESVFNR